MNRPTPLAAASPAFLEDMLERYRRDPASVTADWRAYLTGFLDGAGDQAALPAAPPPPSLPPPSVPSPPLRPEAPPSQSGVTDPHRDARIRDAFRRWGHRSAHLDPLGLAAPGLPPPLAEAMDLDAAEAARWRDIYCGTIAFEFDHVENPDARAWLYDAVETPPPTPDAVTRRARAERLVEADAFEAFMMRRFPGTKRFSGEGVDSQIVLIDALFARAVERGVARAVVAPVHRGRLQLMHNVFGKPLAAIFAEIGGASAFPDGLGVAGDVTYHLGITTEIAAGDGRLVVEMISNPSHLEAVDPVVAGLARALQDRVGQENAGPERAGGGRFGGDRGDTQTILPLMFHTDAALIGQGIVAEILQLSGLPGFSTGGTVHIVINNQIGFTTGVGDARTSHYCTDIAKAVGAPVIHVNADDPDAAARAAVLALDYRQKFGGDVFIDLIGYRRLGHNEIDEPRFTQPEMYAAIAGHEPVRAQYCRAAVAAGAVTDAALDAHAMAYRARLAEGFAAAQTYKTNDADRFAGRWSGLRAVRETDILADTDTGVETGVLRELGRRLTDIPDGFEPEEKVVKFLAARRTSVEAGSDLNWATAEALAWASLLAEGTPVRLSGEDSVRGTFTQRHGRIRDRRDGRVHDPFAAVATEPARFDLYDSPLSEYSVLGFELGYSWGDPGALVQWEAQFGDFANGAQIVIDQFLSAAEDKWLRSSGLVLLLPHGLEGGGPEHSSARLERFLALGARGNLRIVNCTVPANHFHLLRRQVRRDFRKPLVAMTPKSLLRHRAATSTLAEMAPGTGFVPVLPDPAAPATPRRVLLCSGKIYYDLAEARSLDGQGDVALIRLEQLYPFPGAALAEILRGAQHADVYWCQEEPENMGAWRFVEPRISKVLARVGHRQGRPGYVGRAANPSPAPGLAADYKNQQAQVVARALAR